MCNIVFANVRLSTKIHSVEGALMKLEKGGCC